jgi:hypothetical protein
MVNDITVDLSTPNAIEYHDGDSRADWKEFIDQYLSEDSDLVLEQSPLSQCAKDGELVSFNHDGFWQPMNTYREYQILNKLWTGGKAPWKVW